MVKALLWSVCEKNIYIVCCWSRLFLLFFLQTIYRGSLTYVRKFMVLPFVIVITHSWPVSPQVRQFEIQNPSLVVIAEKAGQALQSELLRLNEYTGNTHTHMHVHTQVQVLMFCLQYFACTVSSMCCWVCLFFFSRSPTSYAAIQKESKLLHFRYEKIFVRLVDPEKCITIFLWVLIRWGWGGRGASR